MPRVPEGQEVVRQVFTAPEGECKVCGRRLSITQWRGRHIERLNGYYVITMRDRRCPDKKCSGRTEISRSLEEHLLALKNDMIGIDVLVEIGEKRLQNNMSFEAIRAHLKTRGVDLALSSVSDAYRRFVALVSRRGDEDADLLATLRRQGGISVMVDGVQFDDRSPVLYLVVDAISQTPLFAERHAVRSKEGLMRLLQRLKVMSAHVPILSFVTDMEKGLVPAIREVFPGIPYQYCQLHFLKRCTAALDKPLVTLGNEVDRTAEKLRALGRQLEMTPAGPEDDEDVKRDRLLAAGVLAAAHVESKRAGRTPAHPTALRRHDGLLEVADQAKQIAAATPQK